MNLFQNPTFLRAGLCLLLLCGWPARVAAAPLNQSFSYDALDRLVDASGAGYSYDAAGNVLSVTGPPPTAPGTPGPDSGSSGVSRLPTLTWTAAQNASGLTLYYGTNSNMSGATQVSLAGNATAYTLPASLPYNTPIFWRVDAFNGAGQTVTGEVWNFTTQVNTAPAISTIVAQSTNEDVTINGITLTLSDAQTASGPFVVTATSGNTTRVPDANITVSGTGVNRSLSIQPAPNQFGPTTITVTATDDGGLSSSRQFDLTVVSVNDLPTISDISNRTINEDQPGGTGAIDFTIGDVETLPANLNVTASSSNPVLVPNQPANLVLSTGGSTRTLTILPTANASGTSTISVRVVDADLGELTKTFLLTVNAVNDPPTDLALSPSSIAENNAANATVGTLSATDADVGDTHAFTLVAGTGSTDNASFTLVGNTLRLTPSANFETKNSYALRVRGTDSGAGNLAYEEAFTVTITNVNEVPTDLALSPSSIAESNAANATVGTLSATDADVGDTHTFTLVSGTGSTDNASFTIVGNALKLTPSADFETKSSYALRVRGTDSGAGNLTYEEAFIVTITNVNEAPTDLALSPSSIAENNAANATVGTLSAIDADVGDTHTFTLVTGTGSTDNASFTLVGNALRLTPSANFEAKSSYALRVRGTDSGTGSLAFEKQFTVTITNVNEAPTDITLSASTLAENNAANATVGTLSATDVDVGDTHTFTLVSGTGSTDNASFTLVGNSLRLTPSADFETKNSYSIRVRGTDSGTGNLNFEKAFTVAITNVNEVPTDLVLSPSSIAENNAANATVGTLSAIDADVGDTHTFTLVTGTGSTDNAGFTLVGNALRLTPSANFEAKSSYALRVRGTDSGTGSLTFEKAFTVMITNVNEVPTDLTLSQSSIAENNAANATVGTLSATDVDVGDTHSFTLVTGTGSTDNASFTIAGNALRLTPSANFETKSSYALRVRGTDSGAGNLTYEEAFIVTITNVNDLPTINDLANLTIVEDAVGGSGVLPLTVSDDETAPADLIVTVSSSDPTVVPNLPANLVLIGTGANRTLTVLPAPNGFGSSIITVTVADANGGQNSDAFLLTVSAVNDAPTITSIGEQAILPNATTGALPFTILDAETSAASLILGKDSTNQTLVPLGNIVFGGSSSNRTVTVTPASGQTGQSTITVSVSDGVITTPTTFLLRVSNNNANLASLTLSSGTLSPAFASGLITYNATVPNGAPPITVTPTLVDSNATVRVNGNLVTSGTPSGAISLSVGSNPVITVLVTAQDSTTKTYTITPTRNPLPVATTLDATSIGSSTATLNGTVNPQGVSTTVTFRYGTTTSYGSTATVTGSPFTGSNATSVSAALTGLLPGTLYHYQVLAANSTDSTPGADMPFTTVSDNARLASLALSAGSITFQPDTLSYSITVPNSPANLTLTPTVQQANATLKINTVSAPSGTGTTVPLTVGDNAIPILVTAQDGTTTRTYTLNVRRRSTDATLASLNLSGITLSPAFAAGTTSFTASVPFTTTSTTVTATKAHASANVTSGTGLRSLTVGSNALGVLVTAEDGNTQTYTVTVTREPASTNASLAGLTLNTGTLTPAFASGTLSYSATVAANVGSVTVTPTVQQANATLTIKGTTGASGDGRVVSLVTGDNTIPIVVTAQDGTTTQSYSLTIRQRSAVADLASLSLSGVTLSPAFTSATTTYTATVPHATASTAITAATTHASASIAGAGSRTLNVGSNPLTVTVTAEDGNTKDYTVTVLRNPLPVAVTGDATTITATSAILNGSINAGGVSTSTSFEYGTTTAYGQTVAGTPGSVSGTSAASITAAITNLTPGTEYHFRAKGMNSTDSDEGDDMTFTTLRNNANLASLAVSAGSLSFNASTTTYNMTVANAVTSITVTPTVADSAATVKVNTETVASGGTSSAITLIEGINPAINVLVTAEDGTTKNYALIYNRALSPSVAGLVVSNITKSSAKLAALVNANGEATTVSVEYSPDGSFATFTSVSGTPSTVTGTANTNIEIPLTGLSRSTPYYWRVRATSAGAERVITGSNFTTLDSDAYILSLVPNDYNILRIWYYTPTLTPSFSPNQTIYFSDVEEEVPEFSCVIKVPSLSAQVYDGDSLLGASGSYLTAYKRHLLTGANTLTITVKDVDLDISRSYTITINRAPGPPYFFYDLRPEPALTILGRPHFLDIPIAGQSPIAFQWKKDNVNVAGATAKRYDIPSITAAHAGRYKLVAQNTLGGATSQEFVLGVITSQPPPRVTLATNGTLSLSVSAVVPKGMKLFYYWLSNDSELVNGGRFSGVNSSTLRITGMTLADEGTYKCQVQMRDGDYSNFDFENTDGTEVLMAELPEISANPLPGGIVSALYSQPFPTNGAARKTPTSYAATGLPTGLKCDTKTGRISGRPTAAKKDKFGAVIPYDVTLTAKNPKGTATQKVTLRVEPLPWHAVGVFAAPLGRDAALSEGLGGRLEMTVLSTGILSGKAILGTASWPFTGVLDGGPEPTATVTIKRKTGQIPLTMTFGIGGATHYLLRDGNITDGSASLNFTGWRQALAEHVLDFAGYHTFGILPPPLTAAPRATGYGSFTVSKTGTLTLAGKTADGETITGAALTGIGGDIVIYQTLYTTKLKGSLQGSMKIDHTGSTNAENTLNGTVSWSRPAGTALIYPAGFGPEDYTISGGGYVAPDAKAGQIVMALPDEADNAALRFDTNSAQVPAFMPDLSIRIRPGSLVERPVVNPAKTTLVITSTTGAFTGGFTLVDANPLPVPATPRTITRTVKYQGLIFRQNGGWTGAGYFLMPELPSAQWPTATKTPVVPGGVFLGPP